MTALYGLDTGNKKSMIAEMQRIAENWRPFRTYACLHLWRWKDS
jgi:DNA-3-methyladenine glycosylase II